MDPFLERIFDSSNGFTIESPSTAEFVVSDKQLPISSSHQQLRYIDHILTEEDMTDQACMLQDTLDFQVKLKSFQELLGQEECVDKSDTARPFLMDPSCHIARPDSDSFLTSPHIVFNSSNSSSDRLNSVQDRVVWDFSDGIRRFVPSESKESGEVGDDFLVENLKNDENKVKNPKRSHLKSRDEKKNRHKQEKQLLVCTSSDGPTEEFHDVIYKLDGWEDKLAAYMADLQIWASKKEGSSNTRQEAEEPSGANKKKKKKMKENDFTPLLISCAEFVSVGDHTTAKAFLTKIRHHSSPFGDAGQRLAHYFADGLKARLGSQGHDTCIPLVQRARPEHFDLLIAHCLSVTFAPFRRIWNFACNNTILAESARSSRLHIIVFGISYNFQWLTFIQAVSKRAGGVPTVRITGIDFPTPGPRPTEKVEEIGRRLAHYAEMYAVPLAFNAIGQPWERVKILDLKIEKGEFLVVHLSEGAMNLPDETVDDEGSSRDKVLDLIRKVKPDLLMQAAVNGNFGTPFFVTRFREALLFYTIIFDILETTMDRARPERMVIEREILGKEVLNVIACEGRERAVRPETYKQWQKRLFRAGFRQVPFERELMDTLTDKVRRFYDRNLLVGEDYQWLLMSWKGRTIFGVSIWQPNLTVNRVS